MKVYLDYSDYNRELKLWIVDDQSERRKLLNYKDGIWIATDIENGNSGEPSLHLSGRLGEEIMQAMAEAFSKRGIKTENDHKLQGTLEATKYHLEDMRSLLKLKANSKSGKNGERHG